MSPAIRKFVNAFAAGCSFMVVLMGLVAHNSNMFLLGGVLTGFNTFLYTLKDPE